MALVWEGTYKDNKASGTIEFEELDVSNVDDFGIKFKSDKGGAGDEAHKALCDAIKGQTAEFRKRWKAFIAEMSS